MEIKFYWNGSFIGTHYSIIVNNVEINLEEISLSEDAAKLKVINILKNDFNIDYNYNDIRFDFGGNL
jgi:hypothetical protein